MKGISIGVCVAVAAIAIGVAGCGSSDDTSSTSTAASITKDEFVTQANQICADGNKTIDAAANDTFTGGKPSQEDILAFWSDALIPSVTDQVAQIKALGIPAGDEEQVNALFAAVDSDLAEAQKEVDAGDLSNQDPFADANKLAGDYGLTECAG
jgi:hypothetical protein